MALNDVTLTSTMRSNLLLLQRTEKQTTDVQNRLATGNKINSALDGPTEFFAARGLNQRANDLSSLKDAMGQAVSTIKAGDVGITQIEDLVDQMRGLTTSAFGSLGDDAASVATRKTLAEQFNTLKGQIDALAQDSGYQGKNLLVGNGLRIDSTSESRASLNSITGVSNARTTNVSAADTYSVRISGDGALTGNSTDVSNAEQAHGLVGLKISGTLSSTLGSFDDVSINVRGSAGNERTFTVTDGNESRVVEFFDDSQEAEAATSTAAASGTAQVSTVAIDGTIEAGDTFSVSVAGITFEYTAGADPNVQYGTTDTAESIATKLAASISAAIASGRVSNSSVSTATVNSSGQVEITGVIDTTSANDFSISADATNALSLTVSESFASGSVVSFTVDREQLEAASNGGNGTSTIEKNYNIQVSATNLAGETVTRDGLNERGSAKLSDGENAFAFDTGTLRVSIDDEKVLQAASASAAQNLITKQQADANTQNDITVAFNEDNTNEITVASQNVQTDGQGLRIDYAQNDWRDRDDIEQAVTNLDFATQGLRNASQALSTNLNVITTRENFTEEFSNVLVEGANKLTLADQNEEGTKLLMLQTRQQLGSISLSLANQQQQSILRLF